LDTDKAIEELKNIKLINMEEFDFYKTEEILTDNEINNIMDEMYEDKQAKIIECPYCHQTGEESEFIK
jgi:hypothetical protein